MKIYPNEKKVISAELDGHDQRALAMTKLQSCKVYHHGELFNVLEVEQKGPAWFTNFGLTKEDDAGDYQVIWNFTFNGEPLPEQVDHFTYFKDVKIRTAQSNADEEKIDNTLPDDIKAMFNKDITERDITLPASKAAIPYIIHKHVLQNKSSYELGFQVNDEMTYFSLPIPEASMGPMLVDTPNVTRLFAEQTESRNTSWLDFPGGMVTEGETYTLFDRGEATIGESNGIVTEVFFSGDKLHGRWLLRAIPNVLDQSLLSSGEISLLWKPPMQASAPGQTLNSIDCACPMESAKSLNSNQHDYNVSSKFESIFEVDEENHTVSGIAAAEGTWTDMFGNTYTYTSEFMDVLFARLQENLSVITTDKEHDNEDSGFVDTVGMVQDPIKYITAKGNYNGNIDGVRGFSLEMTLRSFWNEEFQSFIPFDAIPVRLSLVGNPACKICWINQVN